jgi:hypothetical protein
MANKNKYYIFMHVTVSFHTFCSVIQEQDREMLLIWGGENVKEDEKERSPGNVGAGVQKGRGWAGPAVYLNSAAQVPGYVGAKVQKGRDLLFIWTLLLRFLAMSVQE